MANFSTTQIECDAVKWLTFLTRGIKFCIAESHFPSSQVQTALKKNNGKWTRLRFLKLQKSKGMRSHRRIFFSCWLFRIIPPMHNAGLPFAHLNKIQWHGGRCLMSQLLNRVFSSGMETFPSELVDYIKFPFIFICRLVHKKFHSVSDNFQLSLTGHLRSFLRKITAINEL